MRQGRHGPSPGGRHDLRALWASGQPLTAETRPPWLEADDVTGYRLVAIATLAGLSDADRVAAEDEFGAMEMARLVVTDDPRDADRRHIYVAAPRPEPVWSIGIVAGDVPWSLGETPHVNPVIVAADVPGTAATSVADPFLVRDASGGWQMFFEVDSWSRWKGEIGLATSRDGLAWQCEGIVLAEPFHLSYPCVFAGDDGIYMTPESSQAAAVRLYRARRYPHDWEHVGDLVTGLPFADPTVVRHGGRWWLFTETSGGSDDTLRLFHAAALHGPWVEHRASPIVRGDATVARPAGRIVATGGRLVRFAQNCGPAYGTDVRGCEIVRLTVTDYEERPLTAGPILGPGRGWNSGGMHHVDPVEVAPGRWLAAVDGWRMEDDVA
ncbi:MAG: hypothetical protein ACKOSQ_02840 [Planctomycetaceae bacterium]